MAKADDLKIEISIWNEKTRESTLNDRFEIEVDTADFDGRFDFDATDDYGF